jgi:hypothetical protein
MTAAPSEQPGGNAQNIQIVSVYRGNSKKIQLENLHSLHNKINNMQIKY